jgi:hypothetical protein
MCVKFWPTASTQLVAESPEPERNGFITAFGGHLGCVLDDLPDLEAA